MALPRSSRIVANRSRLTKSRTARNGRPRRAAARPPHARARGRRAGSPRPSRRSAGGRASGNWAGLRGTGCARPARSACFISSIDSCRSILGEPLHAPIVEHPIVQPILVDRGQLVLQRLVEQLDDLVVALHAVSCSARDITRGAQKAPKNGGKPRKIALQTARQSQVRLASAQLRGMRETVKRAGESGAGGLSGGGALGGDDLAGEGEALAAARLAAAGA